MIIKYNYISLFYNIYISYKNNFEIVPQLDNKISNETINSIV